MSILIAIFLTFFITSIWQLLATKQNRANQRRMAGALINELDAMAIKLGYKDYVAYLEATRGHEYAKTAIVNLKSFCDSFTDRGAD